MSFPSLPEIDAEEEDRQRTQQQEDAVRHPPPQPLQSLPVEAIAPEPLPEPQAAQPEAPQIQHSANQDQVPPRTASQRSVSAKADRLLKIQRMLEADTQPPKQNEEDEFDTEEARNAYIAEPPPTESSRVADWVQTSDPARNHLHANTVSIEDDSFDLSPSQEIAINDAALEQLERDLARARSPTKRTSPVKRHDSSRISAAHRAEPPEHVPTSAVIDLADSDDESLDQSPPFLKRAPSSTPHRRPPHPEQKKPSQTSDMSDVIDLSD